LVDEQRVPIAAHRRFEKVERQPRVRQYILVNKFKIGNPDDSSLCHFFDTAWKGLVAQLR
jgi:hypothetical protein